MGPEVIWATEVHHPELGELRWELYEYPQGSAKLTAHEINGHELLRDFSVGINHEPDGPDDDDEPPFDREAAAEEMIEWFHQNYEDPANSLPYITREGGYQWVNGGPYSALECLEENFGDKYPSISSRRWQAASLTRAVGYTTEPPSPAPTRTRRTTQRFWPSSLPRSWPWPRSLFKTRRAGGST